MCDVEPCAGSRPAICVSDQARSPDFTVSAGGPTDFLGRALAQKLGENLGQQVIADNRPGAGGNLGAELAAKSAPDRYTLVLCAPSLVISPSLYTKLNYDPLRDLSPIVLVATIPNLLVVHPSVPAKSLKELARLANNRPGRLNFGSGGVGTSNHLAGELFKALTKTNIVHVPYKGVETAMYALLSGELDMVVIGTPASAPQVKIGKLRALAVLAKDRFAGLPQVPTSAQAGMPEFIVDTWYGVLAPSALSRELVVKLNAEIVKIMQSVGMRDKLAIMGVQPLATTPEEFASFIKTEAVKWAKVVKESGARAD